MPASAQTVSALRSLIAARFPERARRPSGGVSCAAAAIDELLGGGLSAGRLTELVSGSPSSGGQTVLAGLLASTRIARQRVVLVDGADGFAPEAMPPDLLRHLVWVRCGGADQALAVADILVRDGNYAALALDLRGCPERSLRRIPATAWYRLQRAAEGGSVAVLVQTEHPVVPAVPWRLVLDNALDLGDADHPRENLLGKIGARPDRGHTLQTVELAG